MNGVLAHPRAPRVLLGAVVLLLLAALVGLASLPAGADSAAGVVPPGRRVAASAPVAGARVLLLSDAGRLNVLVAYKGDKGWHGIGVDPAPRGSLAAWTATRGGQGVPALSAVYGRADGGHVRVKWADGRVAETTTASDGTYLLARPGHVRSSSVSVLGDDGAVLTEVEGP